DGRRLPLDDDAFMTVEGVLRADGSESAAGVSLSVAVDGVVDPRRPGPFGPGIAGGIVVTVVGDLAKGQVDQWRAGRRVRMPVQLHRAARYFDPGVPDFERALARRGTILVGTVKSGALVEVLSRGNRADEAFA